MCLYLKLGNLFFFAGYTGIFSFSFCSSKSLYPLTKKSNHITLTEVFDHDAGGRELPSLCGNPPMAGFHRMAHALSCICAMAQSTYLQHSRGRYMAFCYYSSEHTQAEEAECGGSDTSYICQRGVCRTNLRCGDCVQLFHIEARRTVRTRRVTGRVPTLDKRGALY